MELSQLTALEAPAHEVMTFTGFDGAHLGSISHHTTYTTPSGLAVYQHLGPNGQILDKQLVQLVHGIALAYMGEDDGFMKREEIMRKTFEFMCIRD